MKLLFFRSGSMCFQFGISTFFVALYMLTAAIISADNLFFSGNCPREDLNMYIPTGIYIQYSVHCVSGGVGDGALSVWHSVNIYNFLYIYNFFIYIQYRIFLVFFPLKNKMLTMKELKYTSEVPIPYTCRGSVPCIPVFNGLLDPYSEYGSWSRFWKKL